MQVGDPFMEKLLLEACLEAMRTGAVVAIQDMGAAGLTSSSSEMASRGGVGIEIDLARVPQRETSMTPYEMMLSESQERMLLVAERGREREVFDVFHKWGLDAVEVGRVTDDGKLRVLQSRARGGGNSRARDRGRGAAVRAAHRCASGGAATVRECRWSNLRAAGDRPHREFPAAAGFADDRVERMDHRAVRFDGAHEHARRARRGRRGGGAAEGNEARAGAIRRMATGAGVFSRRGWARCTRWRRRRETWRARARVPLRRRIA